MNSLFGMEAIAAGYAGPDRRSSRRPPAAKGAPRFGHRLRRGPLDAGARSTRRTVLRNPARQIMQRRALYGRARGNVHSGRRRGAAISRRLNRRDNPGFFRERPTCSLHPAHSSFTISPAAQEGSKRLTPELLAALPSGFTLSEHEQFEIGLSLTPAFNLDYGMTETNVAWAVQNGVSPEAIRFWCTNTLAGVLLGLQRARAPILWIGLTHMAGVITGAAMAHSHNAFALRYGDGLAVVPPFPLDNRHERRLRLWRERIYYLGVLLTRLIPYSIARRRRSSRSAGGSGT